MPIKNIGFITRQMCRDNPDTLFVFGDNMKGKGFGGQAHFMRGEPNAVGIPTKWVPTNTPKSFFTDDDFQTVRTTIDQRFQILADHLARGGNVIWPSDGIGTGRARLLQCAPRIFALIERNRAQLEKIKKAKAHETHVDGNTTVVSS